MDWRNISRRNVLTGVSVTGLSAAAGLAVGPDRAVAFTGSTQVESNAAMLDVEWRETYNGRVVEDTRSADWTGDGPAISLEDVLPGDSGTFSFRIGIGEPEGGSAEPQFAFDLTGTPENGINEPERKAGDTSPNEGELQDVVRAKFWRDDGLFDGFFSDLASFGGDNAEHDLGEPLIPGETEGTLAEVAMAFEDEGRVSLGCIEGDETVTVTFGWEFAETENGDPNETQGDGVSFDLNLLARQCGGNGT